MRQLVILLVWFYALISYAQTISLAPDFTIEPCQPTVKSISLEGEFSKAVEDRIAVLFDADQLERNESFTDGEIPDSELLMTMLNNDLARRLEVYGYLVNGQVASGQAFYHAAFIFQHGDCPEHYGLANTLAEKAIDLGYEDARWIYAASLDRYLLSAGKKQKFGTQFQTEDGCTYKLKPFNPDTTDEERKAYNVPPPLERALEFPQTGSSCQ